MMDEFLNKLLRSFERYYSINKDNPSEGFIAEAEFHSHNEQYVLVRSAKIADVDSNEFVFFASEQNLTTERLKYLDKKSWEEGLSRVKPDINHRNSDVSLIIIAENIDDEVCKAIKKMKHSKSYRLGLCGFSNYKLIAIELKNQKIIYNWHGRDLKNVLMQAAKSLN